MDEEINGEGTRGSVLQRCHPWIGIVQDVIPSNSFMGRNEQSEKIKKLTPGRFLMIVCSYGASKSEQSMTFFPRDCEMQWTARSLGVSTVTPTKALSAAGQDNQIMGRGVPRPETPATVHTRLSWEHFYLSVEAFPFYFSSKHQSFTISQIFDCNQCPPLPNFAESVGGDNNPGDDIPGTVAVLSHDEPVHGRITSDGPLPRRLS
ncbi:hypothetical protein Bca101_027725 [Brassica carinata]